MLYQDYLETFGRMNVAKNRKVVFSEEIDSSINGFALGISFVLLAGFVYYFDIFHWIIVDKIIAIILLIVGICGTCIEIGRINGEKVKGKDDLFFGLLFTFLALFFIFKYNQIFINIICFMILLLSLFGMIKGVIEVLYSLRVQRRKSQNKKIEIFRIIAVITEALALAVAIFQFLAEIYKLQ